MELQPMFTQTTAAAAGSARRLNQRNARSDGRLEGR